MITAGKGGVGTSTFTAALAFSFAELGQSVALVDGNLGFRTQDMLLGLENIILYDFLDVINEDCTLEEALASPLEEGAKVSLLPPPQFFDEEDIKKLSFSALIAPLKQKFDVVLLDFTGFQNQALFLNGVRAADEVILLTTPDDTALRASEKVIENLWQTDKIKPYLVLNKINLKLIKEGIAFDSQRISQLLDLPLLGAVPQDEKVIEALYLHKNPVAYAPAAAAAYRNIAKRLMGQTVALEEDYRQKVPMLLKRFFKSEVFQ